MMELKWNSVECYVPELIGYGKRALMSILILKKIRNSFEKALNEPIINLVLMTSNTSNPLNR